MQKASQNIICKIFSIECYVSTQIVNIYAVIMTRKVGLWCFFMREANEKIYNSTFLSQNLCKFLKIVKIWVLIFDRIYPPLQQNIFQNSYWLRSKTFESYRCVQLMGQIENNFWGLFTLSDVYRTQNWILVNQNGIKTSLTRRSFNHFAKFLAVFDDFSKFHRQSLPTPPWRTILSNILP